MPIDNRGLVGADDERVGVLTGQRFGFFARDALDIGVRRFVARWCFIYIRRLRGIRQAEAVE